MKLFTGLVRHRALTHGALSVITLIVLAITPGCTAEAQGCNPELVADKRHPCKPWRTADYRVALKTMHADAVPASFTGKGTTVVHIETFITRLNAVDAESGKPLFGDCKLPQGDANAMDGFAPEGRSCRIKWVQCFGIMPDGSSCDFRHGAGQNHATNVVQGILSVAPEANIVSLKLPFFSGEQYGLAVDWLLTPSPDFGGKSPAEHWNVVAINASYAIISSRLPADRDVRVRGLFSDTCELENPGSIARPEKYVDDWVAEHGRRYRPERYLAFKTHSARLQEAGIMPVFGSHNYLSEYEVTTEEGETRTERFTSPNGMSFPACLAENFAASGVAINYFERNNKWRFIGTNSHPEMTDFVAPGGAGSFSTPLVSGAIALLRSEGLAPDASIDEIVSYLKHSDNPPAPAGISCIPAQDIFPEGEPESLGCEAGVLPYELPTLDLAAAVKAAQQ